MNAPLPRADDSGARGLTVLGAPAPLRIEPGSELAERVALRPFRCERYECTLSCRACAKRSAIANGPCGARSGFSLCTGCDVGVTHRRRLAAVGEVVVAPKRRGQGGGARPFHAVVPRQTGGGQHGDAR